MNIFTRLRKTALLVSYFLAFSVTILRGQTECSISNAVDVTVVSDPTMIISGATTICSGGIATLNANITNTGAGNCHFQWQQSPTGLVWIDITNSNSSTYTTNPLTQTTHFRLLRICDGIGCDTAFSNTQLVTVVDDPQITLQPTSIVECLGGSLAFTTTATGGTPALQYQWQSSTNGATGWTDIAGATNPTYTPLSIAVGVIYYRVLVSSTGNGCNTATSDVVTATVIADPQVFFFCNGEQVDLTASTIASSCVTPSTTYQWQSSPNGATWTDILGETSLTYRTQPITTTTYIRLVASNLSGSCSNIIQNVKLVPNNCRVYCAGETTLLQPTIYGGIGTATYQWQISTDSIGWSNVAGATSETYQTPTLTQTVYYRLIVTQGNGCETYSEGIKISVDQCNSALGNYVWEDLNANGVQNAGEPGISGVTVTLTGTDINGKIINLTQTTDASGFYLFQNLTPGIYTVTFTKPNGYLPTIRNIGLDSLDSDADLTTGQAPSVNLASGEVNLTIDAGYIRYATIGDYAWLDCNENGIQDVGEQPLPNVPVTLTGIDGTGATVNRNTITDATGKYAFTNLIAGRYVVTFGFPTTPTGLAYSTKDAGGNDALDSDVNLTGSTDSITIISNQTNNDIDAGFRDVTAPTFVTPARDTAVQCDGAGNIAALNAWLANHGGATVSDNVSTNFTWSNNYTILTDECGQTGRATVTFTVYDECTDSSKTTAVFRIIDTVPPVFTVFPKDTIIECNGLGNTADIQAWLNRHGSATASDVCGTVTWTHNYTGLTTTTCGIVGTATVTFTATDDCGNSVSRTATLTIRDTQNPVITGVPSDTTVECSAVPVAATPSVSDVCDATIGLVFNEVRTNGNCNNNYTLTRTWTATDACGNVTTRTQVLTVRDITQPSLLNVPNDTIVDCSAIPTPANVTAGDNCDASLTVNYAQTRTDGNCPNNYTLTRTWTVTDVCGNTQTATQVLTVQDTIKPIVSINPTDTIIECNGLGNVQDIQNWLTNHGGGRATDNCGNITWTHNYTGLTTTTCGIVGTATVTFTATDDCDNSVSRTAKLTIRDTQKPIITGVPADTTVECSAVPVAATPSVSDVCDATIGLLFNEVRTNGNCNNNYTLTRTWTATDACGNVTTRTQVLTVRDITQPSLLNVPNDTIVD
ncbi:MAG: hypothetical protein JNL70_01860, partial [Saprospiraceae bacterium]|nr:hypothetical protein [Saprospiraceae bacterium]